MCCVWVCVSVLKSQFTTLGVYHTKAKAVASRCNRRIMQKREARRRRAEAATEIEIVLALDLMKDFYHANSWQQDESRRGAWLGIAATFMVATKLDLYRHLASD